MPSVAISTASSGDTTLVAGIAGRRTRVTHFTAIGASAVNIKFKRGSTDLTGAMVATAPGIISPFAVGAMEDSGELFTTEHGEDLIINLSGNVQVSGFLVYERVG